MLIFATFLIIFRKFCGLKLVIYKVLSTILLTEMLRHSSGTAHMSTTNAQYLQVRQLFKFFIFYTHFFRNTRKISFTFLCAFIELREPGILYHYTLSSYYIVHIYRALLLSLILINTLPIIHRLHIYR